MSWEASDMELEERIAQGRERRRRVRRRQVAVSFGAVGLMIVALVSFSDREEVLGLVYLAAAVAIVASYVLPNRHDEWERRHALRVAAAGFGAMVSWQVGEAVWSAMHDGYRANPGKALAVAAAAVLLGNVVLRPATDQVDERSAP